MRIPWDQQEPSNGIAQYKKFSLRSSFHEAFFFSLFFFWIYNFFFYSQPFHAACPTLAKVPHVLVVHGEGDVTLNHMKVFLDSISHLFLLPCEGLFAMCEDFNCPVLIIALEKKACELDFAQTSTAHLIWNTPFKGHASHLC